MADFKFTELSSTRPADLKAQRAAGVTKGLDKFEKKVAERAQVGAMAASLHAGESEEQALAVGAATEEVVTKNIDMAVDSQLSALTPDITPTHLTEVSEQMQRQGELDEQFRQDISFLDQIKAAIDEYTLTMAGIKQIADSVREDFPVDPTFDPLEDRDLRDLRYGACTLRTGRLAEDFGVPRLLVDDILEGFALRDTLGTLQEQLVLPPLNGRGQCRLAQLHQQIEGAIATGVRVDLWGTGDSAALHTTGTQLYSRRLLHHRIGCECHYLPLTCLIHLLNAGPV